MMGMGMTCDIYLVGSGVYKENPRDLDIVAIYSQHDFETIYGPIDQWRAETKAGIWTEDCKLEWCKDVMDCIYEGWKLGLTKPMLDFKICWEGQFDPVKNKTKLLYSHKRDAICLSS